MKLKDKKGSISIFVLVMLLFMSAFLIILYGNNVNKSKTVKEQFNIISQTYAYGDGDAGAYDISYTDLRKKNRQTMTASTEGLSYTASLELTKTFAESLNNYRIYGNSFQDTTNGNPSPDNPLEIQNVGDLVNLFDKSKSPITAIQDETPKGYWVTNIYSTEDFKNMINKAGDYTLSYDIEFTEVPENYGPDINATNAGMYGIMISTTDYNDRKVPPLQNLREAGFKQHVESKFTISENDLKNKEFAMYAYSNNYYKDSNKTSTITSKVIISNIQIEKGTRATEYTEYGKYRIPIKVSGRNIFEYRTPDKLGQSAQAGYGSPNYSILKNGGYSISNYGAIGFNYDNLNTGSIYTLSFKINNQTTKGSKGRRLTIFHNGSSKKIETTPELNETIKINFLAEDTNFIAFTWVNYDKSEYIEITDIQLELGSIATEYKQYGAPITTNIYIDEPLRKVGDASDYIDFKTGQIVRKIKEQNISIGFNYLGEDRYIYSISGDTGDTGYTTFYGTWLEDRRGGDSLGLCNCFTNSQNAVTLNKTEAIWFHNNKTNKKYTYFRIPDSRLDITNQSTKVESATKLLSDLDCKVQYVLEKPTITPISLPELKALEDYTKIEILTDIAPSSIEVEYQGYTLD